MPKPSSEHAYVPDEKTRDYLLNLVHPDGGSKAIWFNSLGYSQERFKELSRDLLRIAQNCQSFDTESTAFGVKYKAMGLVGCDGHRPGFVLTVWMVEDGDAPRFITAYPEEEK